MKVIYRDAPSDKKEGRRERRGRGGRERERER